MVKVRLANAKFKQQCEEKELYKAGLVHHTDDFDQLVKKYRGVVQRQKRERAVKKQRAADSERDYTQAKTNTAWGSQQKSYGGSGAGGGWGGSSGRGGGGG